MKNPLQQQLYNVIMSASKEELVLMLYDGAIKFINQGILAIQAKDYTKSNRLIQKAQAIILEFRATLNMDYPVAHSMDQLYIYMHERLIEANMKKDEAILTEVRELTRDFRDTWKEAMIIARKENARKNV
ncbi:MAG: flagellar export chaperone FliS [Clostridiales bacterium]|nr:flagellar export chaperone FliS [Clostridiales bacterium]